jgi:hypothetical protein
MTNTTVRKLLLTSIVGLSLALGACGDQAADNKTAAKDGKGAKKAGDAKTPADKKGADAKAGDAKQPGDVKDEPAADEPLDERVVKAASLANKIAADPAKADEVLAEAGLDRASFEVLIYEVSTPELAEQYRLARARES